MLAKKADYYKRRLPEKQHQFIVEFGASEEGEEVTINVETTNTPERMLRGVSFLDSNNINGKVHDRFVVNLWEFVFFLFRHKLP